MMPTLAPPSVLSAPQRRCQILLTLFQPGLTATTATFSELNGVDDDIASLDISATGQEILRYHQLTGNDSNLLIVFYVQIMPDDFVMQLHRF